MDVEMLNITYKIKGLTFNELWFASKVPLSTMSLFGLYCYRDSRVESKHSFLKKEEKYTLINDLSLDEEVIFQSFQSSLRTKIRKCNKIEGFTYEMNYESKARFLDFHTDFATAKSLPHVSNRSMDKYGENLFYLSGYLDGKLTNMQVYLFDKNAGVVRLLHSISSLHDETSSSVRGKIGWINRFLHWQTMVHFKALSFKTFDWGGFNNGADEGFAGIDEFKATFGGEKVKLFDYYTYPYFMVKKIQEKLA